MVRTTQLSKEKWQSIITLRHEGQSIRKISTTLNVSSSAVAKTIKCYDETGSHGVHPRKGRPRVTSATEDKFIRVTSLRNRKLTAPQIRAHMNASQSSRHISTSAVQRRLYDSGLQGWIAAMTPLLRKNNKNKRIAWVKKHEEWTVHQWNSVLWSDESKFEIFGSTHRVYVRRREGEWMVSAYVVPIVKHGRWGMVVWRCFAGDTVGNSIKIQGTLNQHGYHAILQQHAIPSGGTIIRFSTGQWPQTHLQAM